MPDRSIYHDDQKTGWYREISYKTPDFGRRKRLKLPLPNNPYVFDRFDAVHPLTLSYNGLVNDWPYLVNPIQAFDEGYLAAHGGNDPKFFRTFEDGMNELRNKLIDKALSTPVNLAVALGEYRETAAMVSGAMVKVAKALRYARKGQFTKATRALTGSSASSTLKDVGGAAANTWLAVTYGLKPLLQDIFGACEMLDERYHNGVPQEIKVRASVPLLMNADCSYAGSSVDPSTGKGSSWNYQRSAMVEGKARGELQFDVENPFIFTLSQCGALNPALVAWELVPYSFVVDWFLPIGDFLNSCVPPQGISNVRGFVSAKCGGFGRTSLYVHIDGNSPDFDVSSQSKATRKYRKPIDAFPTFSFTVPDLSLSKSRIMSGISLLYQSLVGGSSSPRR